MNFLLDTDTCSAHMRRPARLANRFIQYTGGMARVHAPPGGVVVLELEHVGDFAPGSLVEGLMATYATEGRMDPEVAMLLGIGERELAIAVAKSGPAADYFGECLAIVRAIRAESR